MKSVQRITTTTGTHCILEGRPDLVTNGCIENATHTDHRYKQHIVWTQYLHLMTIYDVPTSLFHWHLADPWFNQVMEPFCSQFGPNLNSIISSIQSSSMIAVATTSARNDSFNWANSVGLSLLFAVVAFLLINLSRSSKPYAQYLPRSMWSPSSQSIDWSSYVTIVWAAATAIYSCWNYSPSFSNFLEIVLHLLVQVS